MQYNNSVFKQWLHIFNKLDFVEIKKKLIEFVATKVSVFDNLSQAEKEDAIIVEDTSNVTRTEGINIVSGIGSSADDLLNASGELGRCWDPGKMVILTRGINSENAAMIAKPSPSKVVDESAVDNENTTTNTNCKLR